MKLLVKKFYNSKLFVFLRNNLNIKRIDIKLNSINENVSISDSFCWRTDNGYRTIFRFSDLLKNFYNINFSKVKIVFFNKRGKMIKKVELSNLKILNEIIIDKKYLDNIEDYGTFHIYHISDLHIQNKIMLANRCYTGFSIKGNLPSFVHGNTFSSYSSLENGDRISSDLVQNILFKKNTYKIQNYFEKSKKTELLISNPTSQEVRFNCNDEIYKLGKFSCILIRQTNKSLFTIKSNCLFLRPIIFNYKSNFLDVFHG